MWYPRSCYTDKAACLSLKSTLDRAQLETLRQYVHEPLEPPAELPAAKVSACSEIDVALKAPEERLGGWRPSMPLGATVRGGPWARLCSTARDQDLPRHHACTDMRRLHIMTCSIPTRKT